MSAPVKKCEVCDDTGSKSRDIGGDLDCTACSAADERMALRDALHGDHRHLHDVMAWRAYQLGKAAAAPVVPVAAQPVAYMQRHIKVWMRIGGFQRESAWHPVTREEAEGNMENMRRGHLLPGQFEFQPLYAAPSLEAQPAGEVERDAQRYRFIRTIEKTACFWPFPMTTKDWKATPAEIDAGIDAAMAQGEKA